MLAGAASCVQEQERLAAADSGATSEGEGEGEAAGPAKKPAAKKEKKALGKAKPKAGASKVRACTWQGVEVWLGCAEGVRWERWRADCSWVIAPGQG